MATSTREGERFQASPVLGLAAGHGTVDLYGSFLAPLLPLFADRFDLSLALVGTLVSILTVADGLSQPLFGLWEDRMRRPWMVVLGPLWVAVGTGFLGVATGYLTLAALLVISGAGRSAYHPQGAACISRYAGRHRALSLSIFTAAGNLGFATGPLLATALVVAAGLPGTLYSIPLGVVVTAVLYATAFKGNPLRPASWNPPTLEELVKGLAHTRKGSSGSGR